jgi:hypothetical protein
MTTRRGTAGVAKMAPNEEQPKTGEKKGRFWKKEAMKQTNLLVHSQRAA